MCGASMPSARRSLGSFGELAAAAHLQRRGASIIARNWRCPIGEIDLVARLGDQLLFVEVKTRRCGDLAPETCVGPAKGRRLARLAYAYLAAEGTPPETPWRIDVIAVEVDGGGRVARLEQIESAVGE
jgi:putative endonuclease